MKSIYRYSTALVMSVLMALVSLISMSTAQAADDDQRPVQLITQRINQLKQQIDGRSGYFHQHQNELRQLLENTIVPVADFPYISARVMGQYYRAASVQQRADFARVFQNSALETLTRGLVTFDYETLDVASTQLQSRYDDQVDVALDVRSTKGQHYPVSFTMGLRNGDWKVINVIVNGINLGLTFRNQFDQSMRQNNRDYDAVISHWDTGSALNQLQQSQSNKSGQ